MQSLLIRSYTPKDFPALEAIHDPARKKELSLAGLSPAFLPLAEAAEREALFDYEILLAEQEGQVLGFVAYSEEELAWLYVAPAQQGRGIGKALVQAVLERNPKRPLCVEVLKGNEPAKRLYESCGFVLVETLSGTMPGNEGFTVQVWSMLLQD